MQHRSFKTIVLLVGIDLILGAGCRTTGTAPDGTGEIDLALQIAGSTVNTVNYSVAGPVGFTKTGVIDVSQSTTVSAVISPLPAGSGFTITITGSSTDGAATCAGMATFDVAANQTIPVTVHLLCHEAPRAGSLLVNGVLNVCPLVEGLGASPTEVQVGGTIALTAQTHDDDGGPAPLAYAWTASSGSLDSATAANPHFTCAAAGPATIVLTVSDGDPAPGCSDSMSLTVTCTGSADAGAAGGAGGTGGSSADAATASADAAADAGGTGGAGGATNVVIYRIGDGTTALVNTGNPVFLDEYAASGTLVKTTAMPVAISGANRRLVASGTATSEGLISRSANGKFVVLTGYDAPFPGSASLAGTTSTAVARVIGRVDASGGVDTTTALGDAASGNNPRSAASTNGIDLWFAGAAGGIRYVTLGASTSLQLSTTVTNLRQAAVFGSQLYVSDSSGSAVRLGAVGVGTPTTAGQTITNLVGIPASTGSPYGFFFADLDATVAGLDTLYVADDSVGLTKYSLVGGTWTANGTVGTASDAYRGVTGVVGTSSVALFAVRKGGSGATGGGELVLLTDGSGYNGGFGGTPAVLATAPTNVAFRGIALAPQP